MRYQYLSLLFLIALNPLLVYKQNMQQVYKKRNNEFITVKIGDAIWMGENLNVITFRNGDTIPYAKTNEEWISAAEKHLPAWCYFENDSSNKKKYGLLYNFYAVTDKRRLAPKGWHIPTLIEFYTLVNYFGGELVAAYKMKSTFDWEKKCSQLSKCDVGYNGTDSLGFAALPGGARTGIKGEFASDYPIASFWSCTNFGHPDLGPDYLSIDACSGQDLFPEFSHKSYGLSVRCVKNQKLLRKYKF